VLLSGRQGQGGSNRRRITASCNLKREGGQGLAGDRCLQDCRSAGRQGQQCTCQLKMPSSQLGCRTTVPNVPTQKRKRERSSNVNRSLKGGAPCVLKRCKMLKMFQLPLLTRARAHTHTHARARTHNNITHAYVYLCMPLTSLSFSLSPSLSPSLAPSLSLPVLLEARWVVVEWQTTVYRQFSFMVGVFALSLVSYAL